MTYQDVVLAPPRPRLGLVLWLVSTGLLALSVIGGALIALTASDEGYGSLAVFWLPWMASYVSGPLAAVALVVSLVGLRRAGSRATHETLAIAGSINTMLLVPVVAFVIMFRGGA